MSGRTMEEGINLNFYPFQLTRLTIVSILMYGAVALFSRNIWFDKSFVVDAIMLVVAIEVGLYLIALLFLFFLGMINKHL